MFNELKPFIIKELEERYIINVWQPMMRIFKNSKRTNNNEHHSFENLLSKLMEFERACVEIGDHDVVVSIYKNFKKAQIEINKKDGEFWTYELQPYGYQGNWEIFNVTRE